jgi:hypothetical protein
MVSTQGVGAFQRSFLRKAGKGFSVEPYGSFLWQLALQLLQADPREPQAAGGLHSFSTTEPILWHIQSSTFKQLLQRPGLWPASQCMVAGS